MVKHPSPDEIGGDFLTLGDGEQAIFAIAQPTANIQWRHWTKDGPVECDGEKCYYCYQDKPKRGRFLIQIQRNGDLLIWGLAKRLWQRVLDLAKWPSSLEGHRFKLARSGTGRSTRWELAYLGPPGLSPDQDVHGLKEYIHGLCKDLDLDPQMAIKATAIETGDRWSNLPLLEQLREVVRYLEANVSKQEVPSDQAQEPDQDIKDLFGPQAKPQDTGAEASPGDPESTEE